MLKVLQFSSRLGFKFIAEFYQSISLIECGRAVIIISKESLISISYNMMCTSVPLLNLLLKIVLNFSIWYFNNFDYCIIVWHLWSDSHKSLK